jgi:hypothetical protein
MAKEVQSPGDALKSVPVSAVAEPSAGSPPEKVESVKVRRWQNQSGHGTDYPRLGRLQTLMSNEIVETSDPEEARLIEKHMGRTHGSLVEITK